MEKVESSKWSFRITFNSVFPYDVGVKLYPMDLSAELQKLPHTTSLSLNVQIQRQSSQQFLDGMQILTVSVAIHFSLQPVTMLTLSATLRQGPSSFCVKTYVPKLTRLSRDVDPYSMNCVMLYQDHSEFPQPTSTAPTSVPMQFQGSLLTSSAKTFPDFVSCPITILVLKMLLAGICKLCLLP